ncbi:metalloprotease m41 ftsh [Holotrichia oblita]|nr:metalloprotease m41 ftsh [Holotrichia oblita]
MPLVGVSGGPDSMVLLALLIKNGYRPIILHVNYHLRKEADEETLLVQTYAQKHQLTLEIHNSYYSGKGNIQNWAREERMHFFQQMAIKYQSTDLFLAHHLNDHLETYLLQKKRKVQPLFYGLKEQRAYHNLLLHRPLLPFLKSDILAYALKEQVPYLIDSSNKEGKYLRNIIRQEIEKMSDKKRLSLIEEIRKNNQTLPIVEINNNKIISLEFFNSLCINEKKQLLINLTSNSLGYYLSEKHLLEIIKALSTLTSHLLIKLKDDYYLEQSYNNLEMVKINKEDYCFQFSNEGDDIITPYCIITAKALSTESILLDKSWLPLTISTLNSQDKIIIGDNHKTVRKFYIDNKVPHKLRRELPIIKDCHGEIIYIPTLYKKKYEKNEKYSLNDSTFLLFYGKIAVIVIVIFIAFYRPTASVKKDENYNWNTFNSDVINMTDGDDSTIVERKLLNVTITPRQTLISVKGKYQKTENAKDVTYSFSFTTISTEETLSKAQKAKEDLAASSVDVALVNIYESNAFINFILSMLPTLIITLLLIYVLYKMMSSVGGGNKAFDFAKNKARTISRPNTLFSDVAGCEEEKVELAELVDYLKSPDRFTKMGAKFPKGVILQGSPGTGKTLLARAVAGEANVPFLFVSGSDFVEMFVGVGASRVRDMFKEAKMKSPCIVFIDEIDAVGRQRGTGLGGGNDEREQTLNQLLVELDGFEENSGILVIAATNRPDVLDPALLRPGRFDRQITVNLPDQKARKEILAVHSRNKILASTVDLNYIASITPGLSGAELANVINEAAILAVRRGKNIITMDEINEGVDRTLGGLARTSKTYSAHEKRLIAFHEAGHAVIGLKIEYSNAVQKVTIIPRGSIGGFVLMTPKEETFLMTKKELMAKITGYLGGRTSEEIFFDDVTTGAQNDIEQATRIARMMVTELGMSELGLIQYEHNSGEVFLGRDYTSNSSKFSGQIAYEIDKAVRAIIEECRAEARKVLDSNKDLVTLIAETLLKKETLSAEEIQELATFGHLESYERKKVIEDAENQREVERRRLEEEAEKAKEAEAPKNEEERIQEILNRLNNEGKNKK